MKPRFELKYTDYQSCPYRKKSYNEALFTEVAPHYQFVTKALSFNCDSRWKERLVGSLACQDKPRCLDLACGTGDITLMLAAKYPEGDICGLDLTESMLEVARSRAQPINISWRKGDMCQTGFPDQCMDIVTGGYALRNAPDLEQALREIHRVLKRGGEAIFLDFSRPDSRLTQRIYLLLLSLWGSFWGLVVHQRKEVYSYIAQSLKNFPPKSTLKQLLAQLGFVNITFHSLLFGMLELTAFEKPL